MDENIQVGFMDGDGFRELEDARLSYFSNYSDSKLDEIYEADVNAREVIDKIREIRSRCLTEVSEIFIRFGE